MDYEKIESLELAHLIKPTQLTGLGYRYQDYMGLKLILDWLGDPALYEWVKLENGNVDGYQVNGLDDVTAKTSDGKYILHQVKFTIDEKRPDLALTFDWLLKSKRGGTSFVQKWATSFFNVPLESVADARLLTNRVPDEEFKECLNGELLCFNQLPTEVREQFLEQLGCEKKTRLFLSNFKFEHSQPDIENLDLTLEDGFCRNYTNRYGWLKLVTEIWKWSGLKGYPGGDGAIYLHHVRELLDHKLARAMPQEFAIPNGYAPPTSDFHADFLGKCVDVTDGRVEVLWGPPGRGKSTYLSHLTQCLKEKGIHVLRHHFFLSLTDDTVGRWEYRNVVSTLIHQVSRSFDNIHIPSETENISGTLRSLLKEVAGIVKQDGKPLVLILDGLDHVYRDHGEVHSLNSLFEEILPIPDNVILLVGTQKVSDKKLPRNLLQTKDKNSWCEIPLLGVEAVQPWLKIKLERLGHYGKDDEQTLSELSVALQKKSCGHPLYLTYSLKFLEIHFPNFDIDRISDLPECPEGDIEKYYALLWLELSSEARTILHIFALSGFLWPSVGSLIECLGSPIVTLKAYAEIEHLIEKRAIGIKVFHGSILVYCRERSGQKEKADVLFPLIIEWVKEKSPKIIELRWLWLLESENGDDKNLINSPTRKWISTALLSGVTHNHILYLLTNAEEKAFFSGKYANSLALRTSKTRLMNASYQGQDYDQLVAISLALPSNFDGLKYALDDLHSLSEEDLVTAARAGLFSDGDVAQDCLDEMNRRIQIDHQFTRHNPNQRGYDPCVVAALAAISNNANTENLIPFAQQYKEEGTDIILRFLQESIRFNRRSKCIQLLSYREFIETDVKIPSATHRAIGTHGMRAAFLEDITCERVKCLSEYALLPFIACASYLASVDGPSLSEPKAITIEKHTSNIDKQVYYDHFFSSLWATLNSTEEPKFVARIITGDDEGVLREALKALERCAIFAGQCLKTSETIDPLYLYSILWNLFPRKTYKNYDCSRLQNCLSLALPAIALDLSLLSGWRPSQNTVEIEDIDVLKDNPWWNWELWASFLLDYGLDCCSKEAASEIVVWARRADVFNSYSSISEVADSYVKIALWQYHNALYDECWQTMYQAHRNFTGYGWRKDIAMHDLLETVEYFLDCDIDITPWLKRIEHIVLNILEFTDGKETRHTPEMYFELIARVMPERLFQLYSFEHTNENWHNCDQILMMISRYGDYDCPDIRALICTAGDYGVYQEILKRVTAEDEGAQDLLNRYVNIWGHYHERSKETFKGTPFHYVDPPIEVSKYGPDQLLDLVHDLEALDRAGLAEHHHYKNETAIRNWFLFWGNAGQTDVLLETLFSYLDQVENVHGDVSRGLDVLFEVVLSHLGETAAFEIIVLDHRLHYGWSTHYSSGAKKRVGRAAEVYAKRWDEFIQQTAIPMDDRWGRRHGLSIGGELLAFFLLKVGQIDLAKDVVETMVSQIEQDVEMLGLKTLKWPDA